VFSFQPSAFSFQLEDYPGIFHNNASFLSPFDTFPCTRLGLLTDESLIWHGLHTYAASPNYREGQISVTQGVLDTGASFAEVEATLKEMVNNGYVSVDNHPVSGIVVYRFVEL
ncbi:MAG: hypothetical protein F6K41_42415, partial [Symploca sp. SIO3E6]|nr:hypothetical protein [Caldora sp. SIO3E6]